MFSETAPWLKVMQCTLLADNQGVDSLIGSGAPFSAQITCTSNNNNNNSKSNTVREEKSFMISRLSV